MTQVVRNLLFERGENMTKEKLVKKLGIQDKTFDYALPQNWVDDVVGVTKCSNAEACMFVWLYDERAGAYGRPFPLTSDADELLEKYMSRVSPGEPFNTGFVRKTKLQRTYEDAAETAVLCQDACNLLGVVHDFSRILSDVLWPMAREQEKGTDWVNQHPISKLFADKLADLARVREFDEYSKAYEECKKIYE